MKPSTNPANAPTPVIVRSLGKMERSMWFCDQCSPTNIGLGCEIEGRFGDEDLRQALRWCQARHPMLRSVILAAHKDLFFACHEAGSSPEIPLGIVQGTPADEDRLMMEEMRPPLASAGGLMLRAKLLRYREERAFLAIVFSHVVGDGFSAVLLLQEIVNFLGRLKRDGSVPAPSPLPFPLPSEEGIHPEHRGWSGFKKLLAAQKLAAAEMKRTGLKPSPVRVAANPAFADRKIASASFSLSEEETAALVARAKRENVSLFALLASRLLDAMYPLLEPTGKDAAAAERLVSFAAPVDLRPFLTQPAKDYFGFYSSAANELTTLQAENDVARHAAEVNAKLKEAIFRKKVHLHTSPLFGSFLSKRWLFPLNAKGVARVAKFTEGMFRSCATSLTFLNDSISIDDSHGVRIARPRGHISPSIMGAALYCVLLYKGVLSVHLNYNDGQLAEADARLLNERFKNGLVKAGCDLPVAEAEMSRA